MWVWTTYIVLDLWIARMQCTGIHLAACMTVLSCTLLKAPTRIEFRSPLSTHPYQIEVCRVIVATYSSQSQDANNCESQLSSHPVIQINIANDHCIRSNPAVWSNYRNLQHGNYGTFQQSLALDELLLDASLTRLPSVISCRCRQ